MHPQLLDLLEQQPNTYFQIFTNGQLITDKVASKLRELGNATPLISIEGREMVSDQRRGKKNVFNRTLKGLDTAIRHKLLTGVATSVCKSNLTSKLYRCLQNKLEKTRWKTTGKTFLMTASNTCCLSI